jgi:hypothetical protein
MSLIEAFDKATIIEGFHLAQQVHFKIRPEIKGTIISIVLCADSGVVFEISYFESSEADRLVTARAYACEIENDE